MVYLDEYDGEDGTYLDVGEKLVMLHELHEALEQGEQEIQGEEEKNEERKDQLRRKDIKRLRKKAKEKKKTDHQGNQMLLNPEQVLAIKKLTEQDEKSKKQELGAFNLHASEDLKILLDKMDVDERIKKIILHFSDISVPLSPPGSVKKLVTMDLELREEFLKDRVRCRPYPASKDDMAEITRQIKKCVEAGLVYEYKKTDYPKHCSPCFLVAKPGSTAKRLVVDYKKVNQKIKLHSGSLLLMENTVETAAGCRYKTKMDKWSVFWHIDLTKHAQDLTAFIAPDGRVYKWRVMPFDITNAPALFQDLVNQIIALCKRRPAVQELLQRGAVLEAHIDDVILGTNTIDDHLLLLREFYTVRPENHLRIKLQKCEFLKTETDYLGLHIGDGWWKPQDQKMKPLMDFDLKDSTSKAERVQKIRQFIGSSDFYRQHLRNFTEASAPLTDLIKKETPWRWGPIEKQAIKDVKKRIRECLVLGVPQRYGEMIIITDASNVGGGGTLLQWQKLTKDQCKDIDYRLRVQGVTSEGFMKSHYDTQEWRLVPLGHWNWK